MRLSDAVSDAVTRGRGSGSYMGTVTAIDAVGLALTVDIGTGTLLTGVRWITSYAPAAGDFVVVLRIGSGWWVLGKNSKNLAAGGQPVQGEATVTPERSYLGVSLPSWSWDVASSDAGLGQGKGGAGQTLAGVAIYPALAPLLPMGATVTSAKLRTTRLQPGGSGAGGLARVTPTFRGHVYTDSPSGAPGWSTAAWSPGSVGATETAQWDLPAAWLTALLAGTMRGVGLADTTPAGFSYWSPPALTLTYTTPA